MNTNIMDNTKVLRNATVVAAILAALFAAVYAIIGLPLPDWSPELIGGIMAVLVASGICVQAGVIAKKLTWKSFLEKTSSAVWWQAMISLAAFFITLELGHNLNNTLRIALIILETGGMIYGAINNPNLKTGLLITKKGEVGKS